MRNSDGIDWHPTLFRAVRGGHGGSEEGEEDLDWIINAKMFVPPNIYQTNINLITVTRKHPRSKPSRFSTSQRSSQAKHPTANSTFPPVIIAL